MQAQTYATAIYIYRGSCRRKFTFKWRVSRNYVSGQYASQYASAYVTASAATAAVIAATTATANSTAAATFAGERDGFLTRLRFADAKIADQETQITQNFLEHVDIVSGIRREALVRLQRAQAAADALSERSAAELHALRNQYVTESQQAVVAERDHITQKAEKELNAWKAKVLEYTENSRLEIADLQLRFSAANSTQPIDMHGPCSGCVRRDADIFELQQKYAQRNLEFENARMQFAELTLTKDKHVATMTELNALIAGKNMEIDRTSQLVRSQEDQLRLSQVNLEKSRIDHLNERDEQSTHAEQRMRTMSFAHDEQEPFTLAHRHS